MNENSVTPLGALEQGGRKVIRKKIFELAGPSLLEMLLQNFLQIILMMMVGRVGPIAVAAVGLTNQPIFMALSLFVALNVGTTAIVARGFGAGNQREANQAAQQSFTLTIVLAIVVAFVGYAFADQMLIWLQAAPEIVAEGSHFAELMMLSVAFAVVSLGLSAALRGAGDTRTPLKINVFSNVLVVALGFPMIYGYLGLPEMGLLGAAYATIIARAVGAIWATCVLFSGKSLLTLRWADVCRIDVTMIKRIVRIGIPSAGEQFALRFGQIIFTVLLAGLGTATYAAHTLVITIMGMSFLPGMAFAIAATTLVGQGLGAGQPELAETFGREISRYGRYFSGILGLVFFALAPYILMLFTLDEEVIRQGTIALRILGVIQISQATQFILAGALRGAGDTKIPFYSMLIGIVGVRSLLCILFVAVFHWGIAGAYIAMAVDQIVRWAIVYLRFNSGKWKLATV